MRLYRDRILPNLIHMAMRQERLAPYRRRALALARGRVLEIGVGSGLNLGLYPPEVEEVVAIDPSSAMLTMARTAARDAHRQVTLIEGSGEALPLRNAQVDTVVTTWTLCSIPDVALALREMRRVLAPEGRLVFVEHGLAPDAGVRRWQNWLTPGWSRLGGGCHLNRPIRALIETAGFSVERVDEGYAEGPRPMTYFYEGSARP